MTSVREKASSFGSLLANSRYLLSSFALICSISLITLPRVVDAQAVVLPPNFLETAVATDIAGPIGMEFSPDGRLFVLGGGERRIEVYDEEGGGRLGVFITLPQALRVGSGLLGLEFSPDFMTSGDVYIAYITNPSYLLDDEPQRFRLSKFSSNGSIADPDSEVVLFEVIDPRPDQTLHQGGDIAIGGDGKIYWALGDRAQGMVVSQPLDSLFGKLLRLNVDGTIPTDNPFYDDLEGDFRAIYARMACEIHSEWRDSFQPATSI